MTIPTAAIAVTVALLVAAWSQADWANLAYAVAAAAAGIVIIAGIVAASAVKLIRVLKAAWVEIKDELLTNRAATVEVGKKVKELEKVTNGNLEKAVAKSAEEVRLATLINPLENTAFPTTPEQLQAFGDRLVSAALDGVNERVNAAVQQAVGKLAPVIEDTNKEAHEAKHAARNAANAKGLDSQLAAVLVEKVNETNEIVRHVEEAVTGEQHPPRVHT